MLKSCCVSATLTFREPRAAPGRKSAKSPSRAEGSRSGRASGRATPKSDSRRPSVRKSPPGRPDLKYETKVSNPNHVICHGSRVHCRPRPHCHGYTFSAHKLTAYPYLVQELTQHGLPLGEEPPNREKPPPPEPWCLCCGSSAALDSPRGEAEPIPLDGYGGVEGRQRPYTGANRASRRGSAEPKKRPATSLATGHAGSTSR